MWLGAKMMGQTEGSEKRKARRVCCYASREKGVFKKGGVVTYTAGYRQH